MCFVKKSKEEIALDMLAVCGQYVVYMIRAGPKDLFLEK